MTVKRRLLTDGISAVPTAALLHTLTAVMLAVTGRIRGGAVVVALTYAVYPFCIALTVFVQALRLKRKDTHMRTPSSGFVGSNVICVAVCAFLALGSGIYKQPLEPLFYADALIATMAAIAYPAMAWLNDYICRILPQLTAPSEIRRLLRSGNLLLCAVFLFVTAAALSSRAYLLSRPQPVLPNAITIEDYLSNIQPEEDALLENNEASLLSEVEDDVPEEEYEIEYVIQNLPNRDKRMDLKTLLLSLAAGAAVLAGIIIVILYRQLTKNISAPGETILHSEKIKRAPRRRLRRGGALSAANLQVRRQFYQKVQSYMKTGLRIRPSHTSADIADSIAQHEDISALEALYRRTRYGRE